jgi:F-type H+-transporting ATPase subunit epsilon
VKTIHVDVVSMEKLVFSGDAESIILPGESGELGIYPSHTQLVTKIKLGTVRIKVAGQNQEEFFFVTGGFLEVQPDKVIVLADAATRVIDLDENETIKTKQRIEESLKDKTISVVKEGDLQIELSLATAKLSSIRKFHQRR